MEQGRASLTAENSRLISVVMPTYNHAQYIGEAIRSVVSQTYENWELIIVNNFSTDDTEEVVKNFNDGRITFVNFSNDGIIAKSRNEGMRLSRGSFVAFLDSDDVWEPNKLEDQIEILDDKKRMLLCCTALRMFPNGNRAPFLGLRNYKISRNYL